MGLDLALGVIVLLGAIRGWIKGFMLQAIRLSGLVACVYTADPLRDRLKPYVVPHLPSIRPDLVDRLLWWSTAAASYVVLVGIATMILKMSRRQTLGIAEPVRNDQYAGFALGTLKGVIVALFLVAGLQRFGVDRIKGMGWAEAQIETSKALRWNAQYQPVARIWASPPVKHYVDHVQRMGLKSPEASSSSVPADLKPLQAASGMPPRLSLPSPHGLDTSDLDSELAQAVEAIKNLLGRDPAPAGNWR